MISVFELFKVGIGPSSSHTVGPMRAAHTFVAWLGDRRLLAATAGVRVELFGSLGATGHGHGTVHAVVLGLAGERPESVDPDVLPELLAAVEMQGKLVLADSHTVPFSVADDIVLHIGPQLEHHSNGMRFHALGADGTALASREYYSVGGDFVLDEDEVDAGTDTNCIERNAVASVKAIAAARIARRGDGQHHVGLDAALETMRDTGADMADKYEETALGGLALNVVEC